MALCVAMCWEMVAMAGSYAGGENNSLRPLTLPLNCKIIDDDLITVERDAMNLDLTSVAVVTVVTPVAAIEIE